MLRRVRLAAGLSQEGLAELAGLSVKAIAQLETGKRTEPRAETLRLLGEALRLGDADRAALAAAARRRPVPVRASIELARSSPSTLPAPATSLLGREHDVVETVAILQRPDVRIATLTGPGGVGKTRLATETARRSADAFRDGVTFVRLATIQDPALVLPTIASTLDLPEQDQRSTRATLIDALRPRHLLLVLDNFEQVLDGATEVAELISSCPDLTVLATSRERLRLMGERVLLVDPLAPPLTPAEASQPVTVEDVGASPAVRLFVERAQLVAPGFELTAANAAEIGEVCRRLDGLPLAIELAAARMSALPLPHLLDGLRRHQDLLAWGPRDAPTRHQTMSNAVAWSYDLLDPIERRVFRQVAIFAGGFTLEGAAAVVDGGREPQPTSGGRDDPPATSNGVDVIQLLDSLSSLVEKSLLRRLEDRADDPRFGMLQTIGDFALHQLTVCDEALGVRGRHLDYFAGLAEEAEEELAGPNQAAWLDRLTAEVDNLRAASGWAMERRDPDSALRLSVSLWRFWTGRGLRREGRDWLERALAIDADIAPALRARALYRLGAFAIDRADYEEAQSRLAAGLAIYRQLEHLSEIADSLAALGVVAAEQGDLTRARVFYEEAYAIRRDCVPGDRRGIALSLFQLAQISRDEGDYDRASAFYEQALPAWSELGDQSTVAYVLRSQGINLRHMGNASSSADSTERALALFRELHDDFEIGASTVELGRLALRREEPEMAIAHFREVLSDPHQIDSGADMMHNWIEAVEGMGAVSAHLGDLAHAAKLLGAADRFRRSGRLPFPSNADRVAHEADVSRYAAQLGSDWERLWTAGQTLTQRDAIDAALRSTKTV